MYLGRRRLDVGGRRLDIGGRRLNIGGRQLNIGRRRRMYVWRLPQSTIDLRKQKITTITR